MSSARIPAASPPPGYTQNFEDPELKHVKLGLWLSGLGMIVMTLFILLRVYTKAFLARTFGVDDVTILLAWLFSLGLQGMVVYLWAVKYIGVHMWDLYIDEANFAVLLVSVCSIVYIPLMGLAKFSILFFYRKLSMDRWLSWACYVVMGFILSYSIALVLALVFACTPLEQNWDITITSGHCVNKGTIYLATAGLNAATDVILLVLPLPLIFRLHVPLAQKIGLVAMFSIGSLTIVTSLIRLSLLPPMVSATDVTWAISTPALWICIEANLVIICGCLPIMRLFFRHVAPRFIGEYSDHAPRLPLPLKKKPPLSVAELSNLSRSHKRQSAREAYNRMAEWDEWEKNMGVQEEGEEAYTMDSTGRIVASGKPATTVTTVPKDESNWPLPAGGETALPYYDKRSSVPIWYGTTPPDLEGPAPSFLVAKDHTGRLSLKPR